MLSFALIKANEAQAAPVFQAAGAFAAGTGNVSPAWPAHQTDDIALLFIESQGEEPAILETPAGFALVPNSPQSTGTGNTGTRLTVYWARATSATMAAPTVTDPGDHVVAQILTYRGVIATGNPWDVAGGGAQTPADTGITVTGVTTTVPDTLIVVAVAHGLDGNSITLFSGWVNANLSSIAERVDLGRNSGDGGGFGIIDGVKATVGATGNTTATLSSSFVKAFLSIALRPAPPPAPLAEYRMDESAWNGMAGEVKDTSGSYHGFAASLAATKPSTANTAPAVTGSPGTCRYGVFNRTNKDYIALTGFPNLGAQSFTITAWIRSTNNTLSGQRILIDDENNTGGYGFSLGDGGTGMLRFFSRGTPSALILDAPNVIGSNAWYFVAAVADIPGKRKSIHVYSATGTLLASVSVVWTEATFGSDNGVASIGGETNASGENSNSFGFAGNIDEVRVYPAALSAPQVNQVRQDTHVCGAVDHYELSLPTNSLACLASTVTVTACADASSPCTNRSTAVAGQTVLLATSGGGLGSTTLSFDANGVASTALSHPGVADGSIVAVTLSGEQVIATNPRRCCPDGVACVVANSCSTTFNTAGFIFSAVAGGSVVTIPTQVAGTASSTYHLRAVKTNTTTQACEAALTGTTSVNFGYECNNPTTCSASNLMTVNGGSSTTIARNDNASVTSYLPANLTFDANGNAPLTFNYSDAGQVRLHASKAAAGLLLTSLTGSSNAFVVKPGGFVLSNVRRTSDNFANPAAANAAGAAFIKAGEAFTVTVTATTSGGATTPNYGRETIAESVKLTSALAGGLGLTNNPAIGGGFADFSNGVATGTSFTWGEVGIITLTPSVGDGDYLGVGDTTGTTSGNVGRFFPAHFSLTAPATTPGCGSFTYFGQDGFSSLFTLTAQNTANQPTTNYTGVFAKLGLTTWSNFGFTASGLPTGALLAAGATAPTGIWSNGTATSVTAKHQISRPTALTAETHITLSAKPVDSDGVTMAAAVAVATDVPLRYGILRLDNAYGSELLPMRVPVRALYCHAVTAGNCTDWRTNTDDTCTVLPPGALAIGNVASPVGSSLAFATPPTGVAGSPSATLASGITTLRITPSVNGVGSADLILNLGGAIGMTSCVTLGSPLGGTAPSPTLAHLAGNWCGTAHDRAPVARIRFGSPKAPYIYLRERY